MSLAVDGCFGGQSNKVICKNYFTDIQSSDSFSFYEKNIVLACDNQQQKNMIFSQICKTLLSIIISLGSRLVQSLILSCLAQLISLLLISLALNVTELSSCQFFNYLIPTLKLFYVGSRFYYFFKPRLDSTGYFLNLVIQP